MIAASSSDRCLDLAGRGVDQLGALAQVGIVERQRDAGVALVEGPISVGVALEDVVGEVPVVDEGLGSPSSASMSSRICSRSARTSSAGW